ncbi:SRR1-like protein isoform X1 [Calliopsis andreniformis]|uniref:SRR1-like protein isoform X1 n=1 Tax=Calliopsis andreniformis TaxID=337506 RepID=UPI003FCC382C
MVYLKYCVMVWVILLHLGLPNIKIKLLKRFGFNVITTNEEGKRIIKDNLTLVYMPHCPIMLTNNFLYANWSTNLKNCIFLSTSFQNIIYDMQYESNPYEYIMRIRPYITEITLQNSFTYEEIFSELNIHFFLEQSINSAPQSFWNEREEPYYFGF